MATPEMLRALDALLDRLENDVRRSFLDFVKAVRSDEVMGEILRLLQTGNVEAALGVVATYVGRMANVLPQVAAAMGSATAAELEAALPGIRTAISFDPTFPRAAELVRRNRVRFAVEFEAEQRRVVAQALERAFRTGLGAQEAARQFRDVIGLTTYQDTVVQNYRRSLETLDVDALDRTLRDARFDGTVRRAIERERPLTPTQVNRMVDRYRQRWIAMRAETIARTEAVRAASMAREEALRQTLEQTGIATDRVMRVWNATRDSRTRDFHASMNGQRRALNEAFVDGNENRLRYPGDPTAPAETVINCRCVLSYEFSEPRA